MNEKFMKVLKIAIPTLTVILIASQLFNCAVTTQDETLNLIQNNEMIEIEIAVPKDEEQGTQSQLVWEELASLITYNDTLRIPMDNTLGIYTPEQNEYMKMGMLYQDNTGVIIQNNTLKGALQNKDFRAAVDNDETISALSDAACNTFADLESDEEMTNFYMAINVYFNLLPDTEEAYANPDSTLTRAEFMAMLMRAETPVDKSIKVDEAFTSAVGESKYNLYAQQVADYSYLDLESKSLNNLTYNGTITRAETIYMLMSKYYADELATVDTSKATLEDAKDGGDIATEQGYTKDYGKSYEIVYSINNADEGLPTQLYKALVLAEQKGIIDSETSWDNGLTKEEAIELVLNVLKTLPIEERESDELQQGEQRFEEAGQRFEVGDTLPNGAIYGGSTKEDREKHNEEIFEELEELGFFD